MNNTVLQYSSIEEFNNLQENQKTPRFNMLYMNARSLKNKIDEISLSISLVKRDISAIIITESRVNKDEQRFYNLPNFNAAYACRDKRGGGCAIFLKSGIDFKIIKAYEKDNITYILVHIEKSNIYLGSIYNPEGSKSWLRKLQLY